MSDNRATAAQMGLWDEELPDAHDGNARRRRPPRLIKPALPTNPTHEPRLPIDPSSTPPVRPQLDVQQLWDADRVAAYLGVPKQTLYAWRHSGKGPKGFRVGKHLRWHAHTVAEWTLALERDQ